MTDAIETNPTPNPFDKLPALRLDQSYSGGGFEHRRAGDRNPPPQHR
jgi:hypothetical protein